jgi:hypothetical protein
MSDLPDDEFEPEYHTWEEALRIAHAEAERALQESPHSISYVCYEAALHDYFFCEFVRKAGGWVRILRNLTPEERLPGEEIQDETILELAQAGKTITAIRLYRSKHQVGLREANDAVRKLDGSWEEPSINPPKKWWQFWN